MVSNNVVIIIISVVVIIMLDTIMYLNMITIVTVAQHQWCLDKLLDSKILLAMVAVKKATIVGIVLPKIEVVLVVVEATKITVVDVMVAVLVTIARINC